MRLHRNSIRPDRCWEKLYQGKHYIETVSNYVSSCNLAAIFRCIDSNATVRQTSIDILQKILEISCIYESLTIADDDTDWVKELHRIRNEIVTDDPKEIYTLASDIARIISLRITNFQYMQFAKTLLNCLHDTEESSAIGASVVLKFFMQLKGAELFHSIPEYVKDALAVCFCVVVNRERFSHLHYYYFRPSTLVQLLEHEVEY